MNNLKREIKRFLNHYLLYYIDKLLKRSNLENGFIYSEPTKTDYIHDELLGRIEKKPLIPDGQHIQFRPKGELQKRNGRDKINCTIMSSHKTIEERINLFIWLGDKATEEQQEIVRVFRHFNLIEDGQANVSDRFITKLSGNTRRGNRFTSTANAIRKYLFVPEDMCPWVDDWNNYYNLNYGTIGEKELIKLGQKVGEYIEVFYEWVYPKDFNKIKIYGSHTVSCYAGGRWNSGGIIPRTNQRHNHAVCNDGFKMNQWDNLFDSYIPFDKRVVWNYGLGAGLLFTISLLKKLPNFREQLIEEGYEWVIRAEQGTEARGETYDVKTDGLSYIPPAELIKNAVKEKAVQGKIKFITEQEYNRLK